MADLIELSTPPKYRGKGLEFRDWTLDAEAVQSNCRKIAESLPGENIRKVMPDGRAYEVSPDEVFHNSKYTITALGKIVSGHREYMRALNGARP